MSWCSRNQFDGIDEIVRLSALVGAFDEQLRTMEIVKTKVVKNYDDLREAIISHTNTPRDLPKRSKCCSIL